MDFVESCMDDARTPPGTQGMHKTAQHDAGVTLSMHLLDAWCGEPDSQSLTVRELTHS